jgi:hypothetical protein
LNSFELGGPRVAAVAILLVFAVYLVVLLIGGPITSFGNKETSFEYAVLVFIPVAAVCAYTITRRGG